MNSLVKHVFGSSQKLASSIFVLIGIILLITLFLTGWPKDGATFVTFIDSALKVLAVILIGALLPRVASFEFGTAKVSLGDDAKLVASKLNELSERVSQLEEAAKPSTPAFAGQEMPTLPPVRFPDDPQRGRFGGLSMRDGYVLDARFPDGDAGAIARIVVEVWHLERQLSAPVTLFLHDTFRPDVLVIQPEGGIARTEILAWGGFTVGAWLHESPSIFLELNLAKQPGAPRIIREQ